MANPAKLVSRPWCAALVTLCWSAGVSRPSNAWAASACEATVDPNSWKGEYFANLTLSGSPSLVRDEGVSGLDFNWGTSGPNSCGVGVDRFSARWTRTVSLEAGTWRFTVTGDDGVRLWVDEHLQVDRWVDQAPTTYTKDVLLAEGTHALRLEYYENGGGALARLAWTRVAGPVEPDAAEVVEAESSVPSSLLPGETGLVRVKVRNTGSATWTAGELVRLGAGAENTVSWSGFGCGGFANSPTVARAYLCQSVPPGATQDFSFKVTAPLSGPGRLTVRMVREGVRWFGETQLWAINTSDPCRQAVAADRWKGEYFANMTLSGSPSLVRDEGVSGLDFNWGTSGPNSCGVGVDRFSARWTRTVSLEAGTWRFTVTGDDGVRLWVDEHLQVDRWVDQAPTTYTKDVLLAEGTHALRLEYYENGGGALARLAWTRVAGPVEPDAAEVVEAESSVPSSLLPGETGLVRVKVRNTGSATWTAGELVRLGAGAENTVSWSGFGCGGFANSPTVARAYLCQSVPPGATQDFSFKVTAPLSGPGRLTVRMVREGVRWFGETQLWTINTSDPCRQAVGADRWKGEYFANMTLSGSPSLVRDEGVSGLDFTWGTGGPNSCGVGVDRFSARWTRTVSLEAGTWRFAVTGDDGVRLFVDEELRLDRWIEQAPTTYWLDIDVGGGSHRFLLEYFESGGGARTALRWAKVPDPSSAAMLLGMNVLWKETWREALAAGAKSLTLMDNISTAFELAKEPDLFVISRVGFKAGISPEQFLAFQGVNIHGVNTEDHRVIRGMNESDVSGYGTTPEQIRARARWDRRVFELLSRAAPNTRYAAGGFSHGTPDFTNAEVNRALREEYAPLYNANDPSNPRFLFTMHNYTYREADPDLLVWFETRYVWLFTHCGFDPRIRAIVSDETGIEAGFGGFRWAEYTDDEFRAWADFYLDAVTAPLLVDGIEYPSPLIASTLFQLGEPSWAGYEMGDYLDVLNELYQLR